VTGNAIEEAKKKRRRRRRGGAKRRAGEESAPEGMPPADTPTLEAEPASPVEVSSTPAVRAEDTVPAPETGAGDTVSSVPKKPRTTRPRKKVTETPRTVLPAGDGPDEPAIDAPEIPAVTPATRTRSARKPATPKVSVVAEESSVVTVAEGEGTSAVTPKAKRISRKAPVVESGPAEVPAQSMAAGEEAVAPQRKRPARKKKVDVPADGAGE
jgi:hypothetical protein